MKKDFTKPLSESLLNLDEKKRSNLLTWRGQFSPELIENILKAYAQGGDTLLDPFCGSGTVLYEAGRLSYSAIGVELNPAAFNLSRTYEFINISLKNRQSILTEFYDVLGGAFQLPELFNSEKSVIFDKTEFISILSEISGTSSKYTNEILSNCLITVLDFNGEKVSNHDIQKAFLKIEKLVFELPFSEKKIQALHSDCRQIPIDNDSIDFVITSPPYINVFNYHQNYRKSTEMLGWDVLRVARSEIGSNRANRGNRYLTVIQYVIDMGDCLRELERKLKRDGKCIFIVGHESNVLGCRFYNSEIIKEVATTVTGLKLVQEQSRGFKNKFGKLIREDLLFFENKKHKSMNNKGSLKNIAIKHLERAQQAVSEKNQPLLLSAIQKAHQIDGTSIYSKD